MFTRLKAVLFVIVGAGLVGLGFWLGTALSPAQADNAGAPPSQEGMDMLTEMEAIFTSIYNQAAPSVVSIVTSERREGLGFLPLSSGSGFILDQQGHIVTNFHVVDGADRVVVNMFDGTIVRAEVVGLDPASDIGVLRVDLPSERLRPIALGNSDNLVVGQTVLAIGNPFEQDWTLTSGIISALNRTITGLDRNRYSIGGVIQTDAAINPGNSGGPLLNLRGEVIGVNSQIEISGGIRANAGVGYAIPSNLVRRVVTELIQTGRVNYSYIGINSLPIDIDLIELYNLPNNLRGVAVRQVLPSGPANQAGLQTISDASVDIITAIDGVPISNFDELIGYLSINTAPGQTVNLQVYRDGQLFTVPVTLAQRP